MDDVRRKRGRMIGLHTIPLPGNLIAIITIAPRVIIDGLFRVHLHVLLAFLKHFGISGDARVEGRDAVNLESRSVIRAPGSVGIANDALSVCWNGYSRRMRSVIYIACVGGAVGLVVADIGSNGGRVRAWLERCRISSVWHVESYLAKRGKDG